MPSAVKRVITNDDIPPSPQADKAANDEKNPEATKAGDAKPSAEAMRSQIRKQRQRVADAQAGLEKLQKLAEQLPKSDCRNLYYPDDPKRDVCADFAKIPDRLKSAQDRVDRERTALETLQENARHMGFRSTVWDPE